MKTVNGAVWTTGPPGGLGFLRTSVSSHGLILQGPFAIQIVNENMYVPGTYCTLSRVDHDSLEPPNVASHSRKQRTHARQAT